MKPREIYRLIKSTVKAEVVEPNIVPSIAVSSSYTTSDRIYFTGTTSNDRIYNTSYSSSYFDPPLRRIKRGDET